MSRGSTDGSGHGLRGPGPSLDGTSEAALGGALTRSTAGIAASRFARGPRLNATEVCCCRPSRPAGGRFDETTGEPESWQTPLRDVRVHEWARRRLAEQWQEWLPRTRGVGDRSAREVHHDRRRARREDAGGPARLPLLRAVARLRMRPRSPPREVDGEKLPTARRTRSRTHRRHRPSARPQARRFPDGSEHAEPDPHHRSRLGAIGDRGRRDCPGRVATAIEDASRAKGRPHQTERRRPLGPAPVGDGGGHRRDRHAAARQQDVQSDDRGRVLRRLEAVGGSDASCPISRVACRGWGASGRHGSRHLFR